MPEMGVRCQIEGVLESVCVEKSVLKDQAIFCYEDFYPYVCAHMWHDLWPEWSIEAKDFELRERVSLNAEERMILEFN